MREGRDNTGRLDTRAVIGAVGSAIMLIDQGRPVAEVRTALGELLATVALADESERFGSVLRGVSA